jgi:hypothetical protein
MRYIKPNFSKEWMEALRYPEFEEMGYEGWLELTSQNFVITNYKKIKDVLNNVNLDYHSLEQEKKDRFERDFKKGRIEIPIVVKFSEEDYDLLGGNTRLAGLIKNGINPKLWVVDLTNYGDDSEESEIDETDTGSSGSFEGPIFGNIKPLKRPIGTIHNANLSESEEEIDEMTDSSSSGQFDVPAFGKTTKGGRRDPLKVDGPDSIYKGRAVKDKKFPKWGGPGGVFVKVKDKCKKYPYCNQGNTGALEFIKENETIKDAITEASKKYGIPYKEIEKIVINDISKIFI